MHRALCCCLALCGIHAGYAYGQAGAWESLTNTNFVHDLRCEGDTVWLAGTGGVVTFDSENRSYLRTYTNVDGLSHLSVRTLAKDRNNDIWFGTDGGGISKFRSSNGTWRTYSEFDGVAQNVHDILLEDKALWVGTSEGLSYFQWGLDWYENDTTYVWRENYDGRNGLPSDVVISLAASDSMIWVGTESGISRALKKSNLKDPQSWQTFTVDDGLPSNEVLCILVEESGVWIGTGKGVAFYDGTEWRDQGLDANMVYALTFIDGSLWAGTSHGIFSVQGDGWIESMSPGFQSQDVRALAQMDNGRLVAGTWGSGLALLDEGDWMAYPRGGPWRNNCEKVMVDTHGSVWCSVVDGYTGKISRYADGFWTDFDEEDSLATGMKIAGIMEDRLGRKWFGSWGRGVSVLDDQGTLTQEDDRWDVFNSSNSGLEGIPEDPNYTVVADLAEDAMGNIWFANFGVGVVVCAPAEDRWETYTVSDNLVDRLTRSLMSEEDGIVWVGGEQNGASRLNTAMTPFEKTDDLWQTFSEGNGFTNTTVNDICLGGHNTVWLATNEGLFLYDDGLLTQLSDIQNTQALSLATDALFNMYVGTSDSGVYVLDYQGTMQEKLNSWNSGLISNEVRSISYQSQTGEIWFATPLGLSRYQSGVIVPEVSGDDVLSFPNPFVLSESEFVRFSTAAANAGITRIFSISGECLVELQPNSNSWDGRNASGELVGNGIYIVVVLDSDNRSRTGKVAVIR
jgi:ligand-binding sensor domain-containing protein